MSESNDLYRLLGRIEGILERKVDREEMERLSRDGLAGDHLLESRFRAELAEGIAESERKLLSAVEDSHTRCQWDMDTKISDAKAEISSPNPEAGKLAQLFTGRKLAILGMAIGAGGYLNPDLIRLFGNYLR